MILPSVSIETIDLYTLHREILNGRLKYNQYRKEISPVEYTIVENIIKYKLPYTFIAQLTPEDSVIVDNRKYAVSKLLTGHRLIRLLFNIYDFRKLDNAELNDFTISLKTYHGLLGSGYTSFIQKHADPDLFLLSF